MLSNQNTHGLRNGASSFVKYVTAFPSLPARPVRPKIKFSFNAQEIARHTYLSGEYNSARSGGSRSL
jgi:hypothetical protein